MIKKPVLPYTTAELLTLPVNDMLNQRDKARDAFTARPDSYGAMASWEMWDDLLRLTLARLKGTALSRRPARTWWEWLLGLDAKVDEPAEVPEQTISRVMADDDVRSIVRHFNTSGCKIEGDHLRTFIRAIVDAAQGEPTYEKH